MNKFAKPIQMIKDENGYVVGREYVDEVNKNTMTPSFTEQVEKEAENAVLKRYGSINERDLNKLKRLLYGRVEYYQGFLAGANSKAVAARIAELEKQLSTIEQKAFEDTEADGIVFCGKCGHQK